MSSLQTLRPLLVLASLTIAGCAAKGERTYIAASDQTITARLEATYGGQGAQVVVVNASTVDVVATSVTLSECENIRNPCETLRLRVPLGAGQRRPVLTVTTADRDEGHSFRYSWSWEAASAAPTIPGQ